MSQWLPRITTLIISMLIVTALLVPAKLATAEKQVDALLQTYLMIFEIDAEVERLAAKEKKRNAKIAKVRSSIAKQDKVLDGKRERAGVALRNFYMQEPGQWIAVALSTKSVTDAVVAYDMLNLLFLNDMKRVQTYIDEYDKLTAFEAKLETELQQLANERQERLKQRERVLSAQKELSRTLALLPDGERKMRELKAFANEWQTRGLPLFHQYFSTMAKSISGLPKYIVDKKQFKGTRLFIFDHQLNEFLRSRDPMFRNTDVRFESDRIVVNGEDDGIRIQIVGKYKLVREPLNAIRFEINELRYQNYLLPDTTIAYLAGRYDLSIYPSELTDMIEATSVEMEIGKLTIKMKFSF